MNSFYFDFYQDFDLSGKVRFIRAIRTKMSNENFGEIINNDQQNI